MIRRLAAILAADVVGYSRLVSTDEAGALARLLVLMSDNLQFCCAACLLLALTVMALQSNDVRFCGQSGHSCGGKRLPLMTQSRHWS